MSDAENAAEVLRGVWRAGGHNVADLDDIDAPKVCKRTTGLDFGGFFDPTEVGNDGDLRTAWKAKLQREGKLAGGPDAVSVRELVMGPSADTSEVAR